MIDANPWSVVAEVARVLDALGVRYAVGGSLASGVAGEPRSTVDADLVVELAPEHVDLLVAQLSARFYVPVEQLRRAVHDRLSVNLIDTTSALKVDFFVAGGTPLDGEALDRRVPFTPETIAQTLYLTTPEDVLLQKLRWFRRGGEVSDRQWRDVVGIVRVQAGRLDRTYLARGAGLLGVTDLLERALAQE